MRRTPQTLMNNKRLAENVERYYYREHSSDCKFDCFGWWFGTNKQKLTNLVCGSTKQRLIVHLTVANAFIQ